MTFYVIEVICPFLWYFNGFNWNQEQITLICYLCRVGILRYVLNSSVIFIFSVYVNYNLQFVIKKNKIGMNLGLYVLYILCFESSTINRMHVLCRCIMLLITNCRVGYRVFVYVANQKLYTMYNDVHNSCRTNHMALYAQLLFRLTREWWLFYNNNIHVYTVHDKRKTIKKDKEVFHVVNHT